MPADADTVRPAEARTAEARPAIAAGAGPGDVATKFDWPAPRLGTENAQFDPDKLIVITVQSFAAASCTCSSERNYCRVRAEELVSCEPPFLSSVNVTLDCQSVKSAML
jgi:hypothetical protein